MPELRYDPIRWRWTIISPERGLRPKDFQKKKEEIPPVDNCPFCEGNEDRTPKEVFSIRKEGTHRDKPGWRVRVVPNKFPALRIEGELIRRGVGLFDHVSGIGAHEVIIETPKHELQLQDMDPENVKEVLFAFKERYIDLTKDIRFRYILIFKNYGKDAGASLYHSHSQLIATPIIPLAVVAELEAAKEHYKRKERCIFCDLIHQELSLGERIVYKTEKFVVWCPYASSFPFETWVFPLRHSHEFVKMDNEEISDLSIVLRDILFRIKILLNDPPYNFVIHTSPIARPRPGRPHFWETIHLDYHFHIEIIPRITHIAGFEWGSGFYINPIPPEEAARYLREVI
ncbi:MAG: galactose-1-phosphate uridylyltransferase [Candidatus Hydrothermales bacterium]